MRASLVFALVPLFTILSNAAEIELKNDSFVSGGTASIQAGAAPGDIVAAVLSTSPSNYPLQVKRVQMVAGAFLGSGTMNVQFLVYPSGAVNPGAPAFTSPTVTVQTGFINELDLSGANLVIAGGAFTVGVKIISTGLLVGPITDTDGCQPGKNRIFDVNSGSWGDGCSFGITGDFVTRAIVEPTCAGAATSYGAGLAGTGGVTPTLGVTGSPCIGQSFTMDLAQAAPSSGALLFLGFSSANIPGYGGALLVNPVITIPFATSPAGAASFPANVPNDAGLIGASAFVQCWVADPGAVFGVSQTAGLQITIG